MHLGQALVADAQTAEVVQVREAALDNPTLAAQSGAVLGAAAGDNRLDAASPQQSSVLVVVIAAVGEHAIGLLARAADLAGDRSGVQVVEQRQELGDVVAVAARQRDRERDPGCVDQEMVL